MVGSLTIVTVCVTLCISLLLPVAALIVYGVKNKGKGVWTAWLLGAAGFVVMQLVIRMPILSFLSLMPAFVEFSTSHYVLYCFILALTAGLFEVAGRYVVAKLMSKRLTFTRGIAAGMGHGGIEAIMIVGMTYVNNILYIVMINSGQFDTIVEQTAAMGVDTASRVAIKEVLIGTSPVSFLLSGYERILTMIFHVALSLLACYFVSRKKDILGIVICLVCHCAVDFVAPFVNGLATPYMGNRISTTTAYVIVYIFLTVVAVPAILAIRRISVKWKNE